VYLISLALILSTLLSQDVVDDETKAFARVDASAEPHLAFDAAGGSGVF